MHWDGDAFPLPLLCSGECFVLLVFFPERAAVQTAKGWYEICMLSVLSNTFIGSNSKNTAQQHTEVDKTGHDCHAFCSQTKIIGTSETRPVFGSFLWCEF